MSTNELHITFIEHLYYFLISVPLGVEVLE